MSYSIALLIAIIILYLFLKLHAILTLGRCNSTKKLYGKTALVTGSNRGIGYYTALDLAKRGARVIITSENETDLERARNEMIRESGNGNIVAKHLDLRSFGMIRAFVRELFETETSLDILVNNAGTGVADLKLTQDGLLPGWQINYLGPFLLTYLLIDLLKKSSPSRIINVSSVMLQFGYILNPKNICDHYGFTTDFFYRAIMYVNSKACIAYATIAMAERLRNTGITVNHLHPGCVKTQIFKETKSWFCHIYLELPTLLFGKTAEEGAQTSIHLAVSDGVEGVSGKYFSDCRESSMVISEDPNIVESVWEQTVKLVKLTPEEIVL